MIDFVKVVAEIATPLSITILLIMIAILNFRINKMIEHIYELRKMLKEGKKDE